jgi:hypothetical protein
VIDGEGGDEALVEQIGIEGGELLGQERALVDHRAARQRADVEVLDGLLDGGLLDAAADDVKVGLELLLVDAGAVADHDLLNLRPRRVGLLADHLDVHRHLAPAIDGVALRQDLALDDDAAALLRAQVGARQEDHADGELARPGERAGAADMLLEEILGDLDMDAGAVAGLAVGIDRAAVPHRLQRRDGGRHDLAPRPAVECCDQADAARIMLVGRIVEAGRREMAGIVPPFGHPAVAAEPFTVRHVMPLSHLSCASDGGAGDAPEPPGVAVYLGRARPRFLSSGPIVGLKSLITCCAQVWANCRISLVIAGPVSSSLAPAPLR